MVNHSRFEKSGWPVIPAGLGRRCWSCHGLVTEEAFCPTCHVIQPPDPELDFFQLFGLPMVFPLDIAQLEQIYQSLQRLYHPDRFATRGVTERRFSLEHVTRLNQAYQTLRDPLARSLYLLDKISPDSTKMAQQAAQNPEFLLEVMEQRELLEGVDLASQNALVQLERLRGEALRRVAQEEADLLQLFATSLLTPEPDLLQQIAQTNHRLRYHYRFLEALDQAEEQVT